MALTLPLELQQHVFQYLDPRSFHAARNVCRWWRHATRDAVTLANQLGQLPIEPAIAARKTTSRRRESVYDEAARALMLGMRTNAKESQDKSISAKINKAKVAVSGDGRRAVSLHERMLTRYDLTTADCPVTSQRSINDLRTAIGGGPWFKVAPTAMYELALSSDGRMLAVALERTVQIYDLNDDEDSWPVSSYITSATGHYIAGLNFEHNDSLLRVQLSNKGVVVYLGSPKDTKPALEHWQEKGGLKHAFLDASTLALFSPASPTPKTQRLVGLQLLRPFANGWLFVGQRHCTVERSHSYCIAYVPCSQIDGHVLTAERNVTLLEDLPVQLPDHIRDIWNDLPSVHVHHPNFSLSGDKSLLAMAENTAPTPANPSSNRVFLYRMPTSESLTTALVPQGSSGKTEDQAPQYHIQRLPLSLGSISGKMLNFGFDSTRTLSAITSDGAKTWSLLDG